MQFVEPGNKKGKCPVCGKTVIIRSTRGEEPFCSRTCASQKNYSKRYKGTMSGPRDRPTLEEKTKFER